MTGRPDARGGDPRVARRRPDGAGLPLPAGSRRGEPRATDPLGLRARQPAQLLPLVEHAGRGAARPRGRRRPASARGHHGTGATDAERPAQPRARRGIRRQLAGFPPIRGAQHGRPGALPDLHPRPAARDVRGARPPARRRLPEEPPGPRSALRRRHLCESPAGQALRHAGAGGRRRSLGAGQGRGPDTSAAGCWPWRRFSRRMRLACAPVR